MIKRYRPDIDGLRAISVLLVLFFHADVFSVKAGFIGVDLFFVISGFLITTGIKNNLEQGKFSWIEFFNRRLWRLQPVFIMLLVVTFNITTFIYLPEDYLAFTQSAKYAVSMSANNYFSGLSTGYFADDVSTMPLLHTCSLSIEWQWYLILPFIMYFFYTILGTSKFSFWIFPLTIIMILIPLYFMEDKNTLHYYYSFGSRVFEMLIGSCLAAWGGKGVDNIAGLAKSLIGMICICIIFYVGFSEKVIQNYPNWWAVAVCLAGAFLLYIGEGNSSNLITRILSFKPLVWIGLLSYSLYIWHWPILSFIKYIGFGNSLFSKGVALGFSFFCAWFSYYFVESKFRKNYVISFWKSVLILFILPLSFIYMLNIQNIKHEGVPTRLGDRYYELSKIDKKFKDFRIKRENCLSYEGNYKIASACSIGDESGEKTALLIGDSHANHSLAFVDFFANQAKIKVDSFTFANCPSLIGIELKYHDKPYTRCFENTKNYYNKLITKKYDFVIIGQAWVHYVLNDDINHLVLSEGVKKLYSLGALTNAFDRSLEKIIASGSVPVIIRDIQLANKDRNIYFRGINTESCLARQFKLRNFVQMNCQFLDDRTVNPAQKILDDVFFKMKEKYPSIVIINLSDLQCTRGICLTDIEGYPVYRDEGYHLTDYASYRFAEKYQEKYGNPFVQK